MQPTGMRQRLSVWTSTNACSTVKVCVFACHTMIQWNNLSLRIVLCMLIMSGVQVHPSWYKDFTPVWILLRQNPQSYSLDLHRKLHGLWVNHFGLNLWQEKGERVTSLGTTSSFSFDTVESLFPLPKPFFESYIFVRIAFESSLDPKNHRTPTRQSQPYYMLSLQPPFILSSKNENWDCLRNHLHTHLCSPVKQVELVYV